MRQLHLKTWRFESAFVAAVLAAVTASTGNRTVEWVGAFAGLMSFLYQQVADRMREASERAEQTSLDANPHLGSAACYRFERYYYLLKEAAWFAYFLVHRSWAALAVAVLFVVYPLWRRVWRHFFPLARFA